MCQSREISIFFQKSHINFKDPKEIQNSEEDLLEQINQHAFGYQSIDRTRSLPRDLQNKNNEKLNGVSAHQGTDYNQLNQIY